MNHKTEITFLLHVEMRIFLTQTYTTLKLNSHPDMAYWVKCWHDIAERPDNGFGHGFLSGSRWILAILQGLHLHSYQWNAYVKDTTRASDLKKIHNIPVQS